MLWKGRLKKTKGKKFEEKGKLVLRGGKAKMLSYTEKQIRRRPPIYY